MLSELLMSDVPLLLQLQHAAKNTAVNVRIRNIDGVLSNIPILLNLAHLSMKRITDPLAGWHYYLRSDVMKKILMFSIAAGFLMSCNNPGSDRNDEKQDVEVSYPDAGPTGGQGDKPDTSVDAVQDSSTTVGYDTSAKRKN